MNVDHIHGELWTLKHLFTYPNEYIYWTVHIALYPFITGLVAGAFVLSSLYHVFGIKDLRLVAKFSLIFSLALLFVAPMPLMFHLTQPQRAVYTLMTPHFYSAIAAFNLVFFTYMAIVVCEIWFSYREHIIRRAECAGGVKGVIFKILTLGSRNVSEEALKLDNKIIKILAAVGIPAAALLHGYVGFIFGSVKTVPLWKSPLMPFIFLMSAVISGIAICILTYVVGIKLSKRPVCIDPIRSMCRVLLLFLILATLLESIDIIFHAYIAEESWGIMRELLFDKFAFRIIFIQWGLGMFLPIILLSLPGMSISRAAIVSVLILIGVFMMRWNIVIGGQSMSRSFAGFMTYQLPVVPKNMESFKEGLASVILLLTAPFVIFYFFNKFFNVFFTRVSRGD